MATKRAQAGLANAARTTFSDTELVSFGILGYVLSYASLFKQ